MKGIIFPRVRGLKRARSRGLPAERGLFEFTVSDRNQLIRSKGEEYHQSRHQRKGKQAIGKERGRFALWLKSLAKKKGRMKEKERSYFQKREEKLTKAESVQGRQ